MFISQYTFDYISIVLIKCIYKKQYFFYLIYLRLTGLHINTSLKYTYCIPTSQPETRIYRYHFIRWIKLNRFAAIYSTLSSSRSHVCRIFNYSITKRYHKNAEKRLGNRQKHGFLALVPVRNFLFWKILPRTFVPVDNFLIWL